MKTKFLVLFLLAAVVIFSCNKEFPRRMAVLTLPVDPVTAMAKGQIIDMGEDGISEHGFVYDSNASISANAQRVQLGKRDVTGSYEASLINLHPNTKYFVNSFLTNGSETTYGDPVSFTTVSSWSCGSPFIINHAAGSVAPINKTVSYGTINNIPGETSKCWITSNLGSDHQSTSVDDANEASAGWYWQFNRKQGYKHDGTTVTPTWTISSINENFDWQSANDPCTIELGDGWRIPTYTEWFNVDVNGNWNDWNGPWNSGLKLHAAGYLNIDGSLSGSGSNGYYWSSTQASADYGWNLDFYNGSSLVYLSNKADGFTLRCLKDN